MARPDAPQSIHILIAHAEQFPNAPVPSYEDPLRWAALPSYYVQYLLTVNTAFEDRTQLSLGAAVHYMLGDDENCFVLVSADESYLTADMINDSLMGILFRLHWERALLLQYASEVEEGVELVQAIDSVLPMVRLGTSREDFMEAYRLWKEFKTHVRAILSQYPHLGTLKREYFDELSRHGHEIYHVTHPK